jgi:hypothetical protein
MSDTGAGLKPLERIKNVLAELWLANCCLAHDSLGFPVLLRFCDASFGRSFNPLIWAASDSEEWINRLAWIPL